MTAVAEPQPACTPLEAALTYAACGLRVLPITPGRKHPPIPGWQDAATTNTDTITSWWTDLYRGHGVGIATGAGSGIWVLDVDVADGKPGRTNLELLIAEHGPLPPTVAAATGTGGRHLLFAWDPDRPITNGHATPLPAGLDIRGDGGQIVVAPTTHPNGQPYTWLPGRAPGTGKILPAPDWLYELMIIPEPEPPALVAPAPVRPRTSDGDSPADLVRATYDWHQVLENDGWALRHSSQGDTHWTRPGKDPRDGTSATLHEPDGPLVIWTTSRPAGADTVGRSTVGGEGRSLSLFDYIAAYHHGGDRSALAREIRRNTPPAAPRATHTATWDTPGADTTEADDDAEEPAPDPNRHRRRILTETQLGLIPPPRPLADGWLYRNSFTVLYGPAKKGKTFVAIDLAMSIATGQPNWLCGPVEAGHVVYCLGEGISGLNKRLQAWRAHHKTTTPANLAILPHVPQLHNPIDVTDFIDAVEPNCPDLIIIDTLARATVGVQENDAKDMGEVVAQIDRIKEATGACILVLHHTGKDATRGTRGSSALTGAIDTGIEVRGDPRALTLVVTEQKDAEMVEPRQFRCEPSGESIVLVPTADLSQASTATLEVMKALVEIDTGGVSSAVWRDLVAERGVSERQFYRSVKWLVDNGEIVNAGSAKRPIFTTNTPISDDDGEG